jgi:hypothetical protein
MSHRHIIVVDKILLVEGNRSKVDGNRVRGEELYQVAQGLMNILYAFAPLANR